MGKKFVKESSKFYLFKKDTLKEEFNCFTLMRVTIRVLEIIEEYIWDSFS